jgi:coupling of ubiquitin conjugation to ER degradation protein 1
MSEVVNVVVAVAVIVFIFKWATSGSSSGDGGDNTARALGFRPKKVTDEQVNTIVSMFPDIPRANIHYELLRTGNIERTSNKILERGFLDAPPAGYYSIYPRSETPQPAAPTPAAGSSTATKSKETLVSRYNLQTRLSDENTSLSPEEAGGKTSWEDSAEKREASLKERKAKMILAARQRMLAAQQQKQT